MTAPLAALSASIWARPELNFIATDAAVVLRKVYDLHLPSKPVLGLSTCQQGCVGNAPCTTRKVAAAALMLPEPAT